MEINVFDIALVPCVLGIVEVAKRSGLPDKWSPLLSLALGISSGMAFVGNTPQEGFLVGLAIGLSACGLYSGTKNVKEGIAERKGE